MIDNSLVGDHAIDDSSDGQFRTVLQVLSLLICQVLIQEPYSVPAEIRAGCLGAWYRGATGSDIGIVER